MGRKIGLFLSLILICAGARADVLADLEKSCRSQKKSKAECACLVRHVRERKDRRDLDEAQLADLVLAEGGKAGDDDSFSAMADYLAGLESHCHENPKY